MSGTIVAIEEYGMQHDKVQMITLKMLSSVAVAPRLKQSSAGMVFMVVERSQGENEAL